VSLTYGASSIIIHVEGIQCDGSVLSIEVRVEAMFSCPASTLKTLYIYQFCGDAAVSVLQVF